LQEPEAGAVEQFAHQPVIAFKLAEDRAGFGRREHHWQLRRTRHAFDAVDEIQFPIEDLLIKKQQRAERLVLSRRGNISLNREMTQEIRNLLFAHLVWMSFFVKQNETARPVEVRFLGTDGVTLRAQKPANAIEQLG